MLNIIWVGLFLIAFVVALAKSLILGQQALFADLVSALFSQSKAAFEISLGLAGTLAFWLGIMKIAEQSGCIQLITRGLMPLFSRLMPDVPANHPALGAMVMNISANILGLDNAATPLGIKAMQELQTLNAKPDTASNAQILFLVINTSSVTLLPTTILAYRAQFGAASPADVFIPILLATSVSTLAGFLAVAWVQKIKLLDAVVMAYGFGLLSLLGGLMTYLIRLPHSQLATTSAFISNLLLLSIIAGFLLVAAYKKINAYEAFIEGAKQGWQTVIQIFPYLVAMLTAVGVFRASGALDFITDALRYCAGLAGVDARFIDAMPTALIKPFSGSGARAMMLDAMKTFGADSLPGRLVCVIQGSTETTFYVLTVYFGAVGIKHIRHALSCGIIADFSGVIASIIICYLFFG